MEGQQEMIETVCEDQNVIVKVEGICDWLLGGGKLRPRSSGFICHVMKVKAGLILNTYHGGSPDKLSWDWPITDLCL